MNDPIACAGLRQSLLHDWRRDFPIAPAPFQLVARRVGGTVREVLGHCHALNEEGTLQHIRAQWGPTMQRLRWRCGLAEAPAADLPGLVCVDVLEPLDGAPLPWRFWAEMRARDAPHAAAQCARLAADGAQGPRLHLQEPAGGCGEGCCGPCHDPELAAACERGLPLVAEPYRRLSQQLDRSEREVLDRLRRWRRDGQLGGLGLAGPEQPSGSVHGVVWVGGPKPDAAQRLCLRAMPGIREASPMEGEAGWPWSVWIVADGPSAPVLLRRALVAAALEGRPLRWFSARRHTYREAPLLFAPLPEISAPGSRRAA